MELPTIVFHHQFRSSSHHRRHPPLSPSANSPPTDPLNPNLLLQESHGQLNNYPYPNQNHLRNTQAGLSPATNFPQNHNHNQTLNTPNLPQIQPPLSPNTPTSATKSSGFKRRSLNLAQLLRGSSSKNSSRNPLHSAFLSPKAPQSPRQNVPVGETERVSCPCCNSFFGFPLSLSTSPCPNCGTIWDLPSGRTPDPESITCIPTPPEISFRITSEDVSKLRSLGFSPEALERFDSDPVSFLASKTATELQDQINSFNELATSLVSGLFTSIYTLSNAFTSSSPSSSSTTSSSTSKTATTTITTTNPVKPQTEPQHYESYKNLSINLARSFFDAVCSGPGGRDLLCSHLDKFLRRPGSQVWSIITNGKLSGEPLKPVELCHWAWTAILFECPILSTEGQISKQKRLVMMARLLGFISSLSNQLHYRLVSLYCHSSYTPEMFSSRVQLTNVFLSERINYFLKVPGGFGPNNESGNKACNESMQLPRYMNDWSLLVSSRVMSLLFGANFQAKKVPITTFYNVSSDLIQPLDLIYDFESWETRRSPFALSGYPCLLSINSKISLLTYEDKRQMGLEARQAFIEGILGRRAIAPVFQLSVRRSHLVEDSLRQIEAGRSELKKLLKIGFVDEEGVDGGGLKKEWFLLLIRRLVAPEYGMFIHDEETNQIWFNPASNEIEEFKLIGTVIGLAIYNCATLDINLPLACYKKLLRTSTSGLEDLQSFRPSLVRGLRFLLDYDGDEDGFEEVCGRNFVGDYESYGTVVEVPLVEGGNEMPVTKKNRKEYVKLYSEFILNTSVERQFSAFAEGFNSVAAGNALSLFQPQEIELLVRGSTEPLDFNQLRSTTVYEGYNPNDETIRNFWKYFESLPVESQRKVLSFITGSDRLPAIGTSGLNFKISKFVEGGYFNNLNSGNGGSGEDEIVESRRKARLPVSHTCFNQLMLPDYKNFEVLRLKMNIAIRESEGFGLN